MMVGRSWRCCLTVTGDFEQALTLWQHAYELKDAIGLRYNLALAYERLGRLDEAPTKFDAFIAGVPAENSNAVVARAERPESERRSSEPAS